MAVDLLHKFENQEIAAPPSIQRHQDPIIQSRVIIMTIDE
jgi:hypothetical protein